MEKKCSKCKITKDFSQYYKDKKKYDGLSPACKSCIYKQQSSFRKKEKGRVEITEKKCSICKNIYSTDCFNKDKSRGDGYDAKCKACKKQMGDIYKEKYKDKIAAYTESVKEIKREQSRLYQRKNKDRINKHRRDMRKKHPHIFRERYKNRYYSDEKFRIAHTYRTRVRKALCKNYKSGKTLELLGCTIPELKAYLENRFLPTMSWDNYGSLWHIDHIKPCASYDLTDPKQQAECFHYTNLQPLFAKTTIIDGVTYIGNIEKRDNILQ